jgi:hypothetical protein
MYPNKSSSGPSIISKEHKGKQNLSCCFCDIGQNVVKYLPEAVSSSIFGYIAMQNKINLLVIIIRRELKW